MELVWIAASYLLGSIPAAYIVARAAKGIDIRQYGSGNAGGANVWTHVSFRAFLLVGFADASKGALAVAIGQRLGIDTWVVVGASRAATLGHNWSIYLKGSGGRGLAPAIGALLVLGPWEAIAFLVLLLIGHITRAGVLLGILALAGLPLLAWALGEPGTVIAYTLGAFLLHVAKRVWGSQVQPWQLPFEQRKAVVVYRLLYDRDTRKPEDWVLRKPGEAGLG